MSTVTTCALCGKAPAFRTELGVHVAEFVPGTQGTGHAEAVDACEACRPAAIKKLAAHVSEQLDEQLPLHVKRHELRGRIEGHAARVNETGRTVAAAGGLDATDGETKDLHLSNVHALGVAQREEDELVRDATDRSSRKAHSFHASVKSKG